ncbi:MAG TPA: hypothetical protein VD994_00450 [Prosthecobacter sp.]|nr:hypothetical protein [Prosthecobacter sp.]
MTITRIVDANPIYQKGGTCDRLMDVLAVETEDSVAMLAALSAAAVYACKVGLVPREFARVAEQTLLPIVDRSVKREGILIPVGWKK